jgi:hypothetical protein
MPAGSSKAYFWKGLTTRQITMLVPCYMSLPANWPQISDVCEDESRRCVESRVLSTPLMTVEPIVDHRTSQRFRLLAAARYNFPGAFNITGMNGYAPVVPFDPGADGVPYASVFHQGILRSN